MTETNPERGAYATPDIVIITGMSGAGRSTAAKSLEDLGWFVVDNLPPALLPTMLDLADRASLAGIAAIVDVRSRAFSTDLKTAISSLAARGVSPQVIFLEASDEVLVRRFENVRRPHPMQGSGTITDGITAERELLRAVRGDSDIVLDTSALNVHELRARMHGYFGGDSVTGLRLNIVSFGYKYGLPVDADLVADCRFLPNPHWVPGLRPLTGRDAAVRDYVLGQPAAAEFLDSYQRVLEVSLPGFEREGKRFVTLAIGCTGGKHRSVAIAEQLAARLTGSAGFGGDDPPNPPRKSSAGSGGDDPPKPPRKIGGDVSVSHRDLGRELVLSVQHERLPSPLPPGPRTPRVVALGGGHGLAATLAALRRVTPEVTAIVTVADDGGSSGRLRREYGVLPPGDLRKALAALCDDEDDGGDAGGGDDAAGPSWSRVLQHRFSGTGELAGHAVGNLLITALWELLGDPVAGLDWVRRMLRIRGRVLPMAAVPLEIAATVQGADPARPHDVSVVRGQASVAVTPGLVRSIELVPADPPAVPEAVSAVLAADWVVFGPGSWFTSVLPHLLVPSLASALAVTPARRVVALNLVPQPGETEGFSPHRHLEVLADHAPSLSVDVVLADRGAAAGAEDELEKAAELLHASLVLSDVAAPDGARHDPELLANAYRTVFSRGGRGVHDDSGGGSQWR